jgi:trigger factor
MTVNVETLEKLQRRITLELPAQDIDKEVETRLRRLSRQVKADGFRPGKVPMSVVTQRYGAGVHYEVLNDRIGEAFAKAANEAKLRVAGVPNIAAREGAPDGTLSFDATFEVYPEVTIGDLSAATVDRIAADIDDAAIDKTIEILRKQRRTFAQRAAADGAVAADRVTIDFEGKIDGEPFEGGKAAGFAFVIGEGQMLEQFDQGVRGMKVGGNKTFPVKFPDDYHGKDIAGKEADFLVTMKKIEAPHLPDVDDGFAKALGIKDPTVAGLREDVRKNLQREVKFRVQARNKAAVMDALSKAAELELPKALIDSEVERMVQNARAELEQRGVKDAKTAPIPPEIFHEQAQRRVRLGLIVSELVRANNLQAKPQQLQAHIEELSQSYEKPSEVMRYYLGDRQRMADVEAVVIENNVTEFVLGKVQVTDKAVAFDELMNA